jgi:hypothetical protein
LSPHQQLILSQQEQAINKLTQSLIKDFNVYRNNPIIRDIFKLKNQDFRRSVVYILGGIGEGIKTKKTTGNTRNTSLIDERRLQAKKKIVEALMMIVNNRDEDLNIRWMAASSLQRMKVNMDKYFSRNNLTNPRTAQSIDLLTDADQEKISMSMRPMLEFDIYSGEYIYHQRELCGGGIPEIYFALRNLLNKTKK